MLLTFHSRTLSRKRNTLWTLFLTVANLLVLQFYFERVMSEPQDINAYIPFIDEDEEKDDGYVKHSEAPSEPLNKAGSQINSEKREECFESSTTELDKNKNRERNQNTAGCLQNDKSHPVASGGFNEAIHTTSTHPKKYDDTKNESDEDYDSEVGPSDTEVRSTCTYGDKDQNTVNKSHKDNKYGNNMEIIPSHKEEQANSGEKKYDIDGSIQDKWEQYDNQAQHEKSSFKRKAMTGDNSSVQDSKDQAEIREIPNGDNTQSTERAGSISSHKVNPEEKKVGNSDEASDEGPDTNYISGDKPIKHKPKTSAIDNDKPEKDEIKAVESEQDGRLERKNNDKGCDVETGKHGKECEENSKQDALKRLQKFEKKNNATEGPDGDNPDAVSLKTTGMHKKCSSSSKQEKGSKPKKDTYHTDEHSKSGNWNREKMHEQDISDVDPYWESRINAMEKYVYFWRGRDVYSQWHKSKFYINGQNFTCAEQYMMYKKAELFQDLKLRGQILKTKDPHKMKALGRKVSNFDELLWRSQCLYVVKEGNLEKFSQNKEMENQLFKTYPKVLVEASPFDQIWGIGLDEDSPEAYDESTWDGLNLLGFILTEVRDELMFKAGVIKEDQKQVYLEELRIKYCAQLEQYLEYFSSVGDDKTEEREDASRSKPGSDDRHEMNNDNKEEVVHGETKISEAEPTKKVMGALGKKSERDGKNTKNKNLKDNAYQTKSKTLPAKVFPGSAQRQEISENINEAKGGREMPDVQERQQNDKQRSQVTTKIIVTTSDQKRYNQNPEIFYCDDFPPLSHEIDKKEENVVSKPKSKKNIKRKKENDNEVQEKEERESKIAEYVESMPKSDFMKAEEVKHVDQTDKKVCVQFSDKIDGIGSVVFVDGVEGKQPFEKQALDAGKCDGKEKEDFKVDDENVQTKDSIKDTERKEEFEEQKEYSHEKDAEDSFTYKQTELDDASCDEHTKTDSLLAVFQIKENNLAQPLADPTKEFVSDMHEEKLTVPEVVKGPHNCRTLTEERKSKDPREVKTETLGKFTKKSHSTGHPPPSPTKPKPNYQAHPYHKKGDKESDIF